MGGTKFIYQIISRLNKHIPVTVIVENYSKEVEQNYQKENIKLIKTINITSTSPLYWLFLPRYIKKNYEKIRNLVDRDTILISSMFPMNAIYNMVRRENKDFGIPIYQYIFEPFAFIHDNDLIDNLPLAKKIFTKYVARRFRDFEINETRKSDKIFTLNDITKDAIKKIYGRDAIPTFTGIDIDFFKHYETPDLEEKYKGKRILIHSTDFSPIKGTDMIIKALPKVTEKYPNVLLLITSTINDKQGWGKIRDLAYKLKIIENIQYLGFLPYEDLPRYYSFAEALLQSGIGGSGATSFSLPVKEALACETPVIRHPITTEDAEHMISGLLIDSKDTRKYADGIIWILDHPKEAKAMGKRGREKIAKKFIWDNVIKIILENI